MKKRSLRRLSLLLCAAMTFSLTGCSIEEQWGSIRDQLYGIKDGLINELGEELGGIMDLFRPKQKYEAYYKPITEEDVAVEDGVYYADSYILLTTAEDAKYRNVKSMLKKYDGEITGYISTTNDYQVFFPEGKTYQELNDVVQELKQDSMVEEAYLCYLAEMELDSVTYTNDPWQDTGTATDRTSSVEFDSSECVWDEGNPEGLNWWAEAIGMPSVWDMDLEFQPVKVGIIDSMFDVSNKDFEDNVFVKTWNNPKDKKGKCNVSDLYNQAVKEYETASNNNNQEALDDAEDKMGVRSHGTHVAGIIAAKADNGYGIAGVSQNAQLYGYAKKSDEARESVDLKWQDIFCYKVALADLLNEGVKVINISMGSGDSLVKAQEGDANWTNYFTVNNEALESFLRKYIDMGTEFLIVKSSGNNGRELKYDTRDEIFCGITDKEISKRIIVVGAAELTDESYKIAGFSNTGERVDVFAPGSGILSDIPAGIVTLKDGTSMAAPIVSGLAALIWGINPDLTAEQVRQIIITSTYGVDLSKGQIYSLENELTFDKNDDIRNGIIRLEDIAEIIDHEETTTWTNRTTIVNAKKCVDLALKTVNTEQKTIPEFGTLNGVIYSRNPDGTGYEDFEVTSLSVYDEQGNNCLPADSVKKMTLTDTGENETTIFYSINTYTALLPPGTYTIEATADGFEKAVIEGVTIAAGDVQELDIELKNLKASMYRSYYDKLQELQTQYGTGSIATDEYESALLGLCFAKLVDFDGDGWEELLLAYCSGVDHNTPDYKLEIWNFNDGNIGKVFDGACYQGYDIYAYIDLVQEGDKYYIFQSIDGVDEYARWWGDDGGFQWVMGGVILGYDKNEIFPAHSFLSGSYVSAPDQFVNQMDGVEIPEEEFPESESHQKWDALLRDAETFEITTEPADKFKLENTLAVTEDTWNTLRKLSGNSEDGAGAETQGDAEAGTETPETAEVPSDNSGWKQAYEDYIQEVGPGYDAFTSTNQYKFYLLDINGDDIPELYVDFCSGSEGGSVSTYDGEQRNTVLTGGDSGLSYIPGENMIHISGGRMDTYKDLFYAIKDGQFVLCGSGEWGIEDYEPVYARGEILDSDYTYYWEGQKVDKDRYEENMRNLVDPSREVEHYDGEAMGYMDILGAIKAYE